MDLQNLLKKALEVGASDIHLKAGNHPHLRIQGELTPIRKLPPLSREDTLNIAEKLLNRRQQEILAQDSEVDFSFGVEGVGRFRVSAFQQRGSLSLALRLIPQSVANLDELNLPPVLKDIAGSERGLVLVTGVTGSGKSTTLASMIRRINERYRRHILTIEDPIEFVIEDQKSIVSQREAASDTADFSTALRSALRQDPDVILVGEIRDLDTLRIALQAAQTGHLVFSTLHTTDVVATVDRVINMFPPGRQSNIRLQLASCLRAVISMRLIRSSVSKKRLPAVEVLVSTEQIESILSQKERIKELRQAMEKGQSQYGMQTFDSSIFQHYKNRLISREDALRAATSPEEMKLRIEGVISSSEEV